MALVAIKEGLPDRNAKETKEKAASIDAVFLFVVYEFVVKAHFDFD